MVNTPPSGEHPEYNYQSEHLNFRMVSGTLIMILNQSSEEILKDILQEGSPQHAALLWNRMNPSPNNQIKLFLRKQHPGDRFLIGFHGANYSMTLGILTIEADIITIAHELYEPAPIHIALKKYPHFFPALIQEAEAYKNQEEISDTSGIMEATQQDTEDLMNSKKSPHGANPFSRSRVLERAENLKNQINPTKNPTK